MTKNPAELLKDVANFMMINKYILVTRVKLKEVRS